MRFNWSSIKEYSAVIDVRTPSEYRIDHIPGALNMPVLDDREREAIGTLYRSDSFAARRQGMAIIAARMSQMVGGPLSDKDMSWCPLVYCARGGLRSGSLVGALRQVGWQANALPGGYKAYRRHVLDTLAEVPRTIDWHVLCGATGAGKTMLLRQLEHRGEQTLDLELLAKHRGSLFGSQGAQPAQRAFETALAARLLGFDRARAVFVEAESLRIGVLYLPKELLRNMRCGKVVLVRAQLQERARYTAAEYAKFSDQRRFAEAVAKLAKYVGRARVEQWRELHRAGCNAELAAQLLQLHYDRKYAWSLGRHYDLAKPWAELELAQVDQAAADAAAGRIQDMLRQPADEPPRAVR